MQSILQVPWVLIDYQKWLDTHPPLKQDDYLFSESRIRFEPTDSDRLFLLDSITPTEVNGAPAIQWGPQSPPIATPFLNRQKLDALLGTLRQRPLLVELPFRSKITQTECDKFLNLGFGRFVFVPETLAEFESRVPATEIVRFPASPYEIVRNYWLNVGQLSVEVTATLDRSKDPSAFTTWLRMSHIKLLLGDTLDSFYRPSSPIARHRVMPGALYTRPTHSVSAESGTYIIDGPRINATAVGGRIFHRMLQKSVENGRPPETVDQVPWGQLIVGRARTDEDSAEWFLPPRPMSDGHFDDLCRAWNAALGALDNGSLEDGVASLGRFHWSFVRLHPFACANQSLAFALVNCVLRQYIGCGIPQLILDHLALRHTCVDYIRFFKRALVAWRTGATSPLERQRERIEKRQLLDRFISSLRSIDSEGEATSLMRNHPEAAHLALLTDT